MNKELVISLIFYMGNKKKLIKRGLTELFPKDINFLFNITATYNEKNGWSVADEDDLYELCEGLDRKGVKFGLSNVFENKGIKNDKLISWCNEKGWNVYTFDKFTYMACGKGNSNAKEVFITNY